ncbi:MAG: cyclodeaminase/cyclohydrolase family protein [Candidatus Omnitrophica bacterium]|nr:cyclodeaminase/cyclohydrolase family protein [Candidatus Omnitrophota bacterium]
MAKKYRDYQIAEYLQVLSAREPVPGGGSVAALTAALAAGLLAMVTRYSLGRGAAKPVEQKLARLLTDTDKIRDRFLDLAEEDSAAYLAVVASRKGTPAEKKAAQKQCDAVLREMKRLCPKAVGLAPYLVTHGSPYLLSDIEVAVELLNAAFNSVLALSHS